MKLTFFGRLRDVVGTGELNRSAPPDVIDSDSLRAWIGLELPDLLDPTVRIAFDDVLVTGTVPTAGVSEAAFLPPVSGG